MLEKILKYFLYENTLNDFVMFLKKNILIRLESYIHLNLLLIPF